jgi:hypothetical protein
MRDMGNNREITGRIGAALSVQLRAPNGSLSEHMRLIADKRIGRVQRQIRRCRALGSARIRDGVIRLPSNSNPGIGRTFTALPARWLRSNAAVAVVPICGY